jgi:hypothetical protein
MIHNGREAGRLHVANVQELPMSSGGRKSGFDGDITSAIDKRWRVYSLTDLQQRAI